ncbi:hypothetical protein AVEN_219163-1 [Araneus ventricosus]|uniref:DNA helicase Pif1-like 2B domain-containing protein n=1 Tax=Araneus ventricosus TaxID=182803 RepID=A0A4Y2FQF3_ARAVE|nr:hypothetical protein AVEN_219163-1 [Araneus ventricosus]
MNLCRAVGYIIRNEQRRTEWSQEIFQKSTVRRSIRNEADNRRRPKRVCIRNDVEEHNCGTMSEQCGFCGAVYWKAEKNTAHKSTKCCHDGKVQLPAFPVTENSPDAKNYRQRIRFSIVTPQELKARALLTVNNERSMEIYNKVLEFMPGNETIYKAVDTIISEDPQDQLTFPEEFLNSLTPTGLPPYELKLKMGCIIMLLRNLAPSKGLCNGTRLIVTKLQQNIIQAKSIDGTETFLIPRIPLISSQFNMSFKFKRMQFSIRLAFTMTINKLQGQTFENICLVLNEPVFSHGQLCVGLSRARSFESVSVVAPKC